ncbi:DUF397 domain-containing protein [Streptomyces sp. NPDC000878]
MSQHVWTKSSHCQEGEACVHISVTAETVLLADSATPSPAAILSISHPAFTNLIRMLKADG